MTKATVAGEGDSPGAGCRPCCSIPSGFYAILVGIFATAAIALTWTAARSCLFLDATFTYCPPVPEPDPAYACCGDCYCINEDEPCPSRVPNMNISEDTLNMFNSLTPTNPYNLTCNPYDTQYNGVPCETTPPQNFTELGDAAICGVLYDTASLNENQCPTQYSLQSFPDLASAEAAGATVTHHGACGVCSTTQDLAVYIESTDLTSLGVQCSFQFLLGTFEDGVRCYQRAGYTRPCAAMWVYNADQTKDYCGATCTEFTAQDRPNNGPPPQCTLDDCLDCDETESGPLFAKIAARTRRRSGLLSKIARPCDDILFVDHQNPCDVVQNIEREFQQEDVCQQTEPTDLVSCAQITRTLGLESYEAPDDGKWISLGNDENIYSTVYGKCKRYDIRKAEDGFWLQVSETLGAAWKFARIAALIATIIGSLTWIFVWAACCIAYPKNFWFACTGLFTLCGILELLTLVFLASDVCGEGGCTLLAAAYCAIFAGILWFVTAGLCWKTASQDLANVYIPVVYDILITETIGANGTITTEKVTKRSNGTSVVERTALVKKIRDDKGTSTVESMKHVDLAVAASETLEDDHSFHSASRECSSPDVVDEGKP